MPSKVGWLDYSENERRKALDVIDLFREQDTRDELGIGTVRDALGDALFPGLSTIQTRARYFLFVPWIYLDLEAQKTASRHVALAARRKEIELVRELLKSSDHEGLIGRLVVGRLQRLPSSIYWQGLRVLGVRQFSGSLEQYHRSLDDFYSGRQLRLQSEDGIVELFRPKANWHEGLPPAPEGFPVGADFHLRAAEAEYLRQQLMAHVPGTFLSLLVDRGEWWEPTDFPWQHPQCGECSGRIQETLRHARLFSLALWGAALFYNRMLAERHIKTGSDGQTGELAGRYRKRLTDWFDAVAAGGAELAQWSEARQDFWSVIERINPRVPKSTVRFVNAWLDIASEIGRIEELLGSAAARDLIRNRERRLKGRRARLENPRALEMWSGAAGVARLSYRWPQVQVIVKDILEGLGRGVRRA